MARPFMSAVLSSPETSRRLMERLTAIIRRSTGRIFDLSVYGANIRIYADLLRLSKPAADGGNGGDGRGLERSFNIAEHHSSGANRTLTIPPPGARRTAFEKFSVRP